MFYHTEQKQVLKMDLTSIGDEGEESEESPGAEGGAMSLNLPQMNFDPFYSFAQG